MGSVREQRSDASKDEPIATILITIDSLRSDGIGDSTALRYTLSLTTLGKRGTTFENAFTHSNWTPFSFPAMLASKPVFATSADISLPDSPTLAEVLQDRDVTTAGINAANGFLTGHWGYDRGFDEFQPYISETGSGLYGTYLTAHPTVHGWIRLATKRTRETIDRIRRHETERRIEASAEDIGANAQAFISDAELPFFLWIHYMDAHTPYIPAPRYVKQVTEDRVGILSTLRAHAHTGLGLDVNGTTLERLWQLYRSAIRQIDASIQAVLRSLAAHWHRLTRVAQFRVRRGRRATVPPIYTYTTVMMKK
jgi:arylsulfatase A-like enzyme